jgi:type II secretory pathway pseudopilin PulG
MAALLVAIAVIGVVISVVLPVWRTAVQREREEELVFRGRQYARAIQLFQRKYANSYPPNLDVLIEQRFLRKKYKDPVNKNGDFEILYQNTLARRTAAQAGRGGTTPSAVGQAEGQGAAAGSLAMPGSAFGSQVAGPQGGIVGVASKNTSKSIMVYDGRTVYNEWQFVWTPTNTTPRAGQSGSALPGQRGLMQGGRGAAGSPGAPIRPPD